MLKQLRASIDNLPGGDRRQMIICGDGHYTVGDILKNLPRKTSYIGRTRADLHICKPAPKKTTSNAGRPPSYGEQLPTPEEIRKNKSWKWTKTQINRGDSYTKIRYKFN